MADSDKLNRRRVLQTGTVLLAGLAGCTDSDSSDGGSGDGSDGADGGDGGDTNEPTETDTPREAESVVGQVVSGESLQMVVRETSYTKTLGEFSEADEGKEFLVVRMAAKNTSDEYTNFSGFWQARVKDSENHVYDSSFESTSRPLNSGVLAPGEVTRGDLVFELPEDASELTLQFDFEVISWTDFSRVNIDLEQQADSIGDVSQSLDISINGPGDSTSHGTVGVTLNSVRMTEQVGDYAEAEEGHEFVITDIEIENQGDEPLSVSTLLQMAVKDGEGFTYGSDLSATSELDRAYEEGSKIAAGESRRGEIAYEAPKDASLLYWVFDFLDFDAEMKAFWKVKG